MTKFMLSAATAALLTATGASAQVVDSFNQTVDDALSGVPASFASMAINNMSIDGSIDISGDAEQAFNGALNISEASSSSGSGENSEVSDSAGSFNFDIASQLSATDGGEATDVFGNVADATTGGSAAFEGSLAGAGSVSEAVSNSSSTASSEASESMLEGSLAMSAATQSVGDVASLAAGAVNTGNFDVSESAGVLDSSSGANTSNTGANASALASFGSGVGIVSAAVNDATNTSDSSLDSLATINGSVGITMAAGNFSVGSVDSVAAGAINTTDVTAVFFGSDAPNP